MGAILETDRLRLRSLELADEDAMLAVLSDPVVMQWYPQALSREGTRDWIERNRRRWSDYGGGLFGMELRASGELIGDCGPTRHEIDGQTELEIGYHVRRDQWGQGFATEAARAVMGFAFAHWQPHRLISMIRPENLPSRRVAEKNGLALDKVVFWRGYDHCVYQKKAEDWPG
jgi:RimJ/RimL family protein N-acetyltransferase